MTNVQVLKLTKTKELIFSLVFTGLAVLTPLIFHLAGAAAAGKMFLPMHFFILITGLFLGWRAGLFIGLSTPLISYSLASMPPAAILPFVVIEACLYGFLAGLLSRKLNIFFALVGALILARLFLAAAIFVLPTNLNAFAYVFGAIKAGWPGILAQLVFVPIIVKKLCFLNNERL